MAEGIGLDVDLMVQSSVRATSFGVFSEGFFSGFRDSNSIAFTNSVDARITYGQLECAANVFAKIFGAIDPHSIKDNVLIATGQKVLDAVLAVCCIHAGLRFTIVDKQKDVTHHAYVCSHSDATLVFVGDTSVPTREWVSELVTQITHVELKEGVLVIDGAIELPESPIQAVSRIADVRPQAIFYSSGSTGKPKGIVVSRQLLWDGGECVSSYLGLTQDDVILSYLPISFDYGFNQILCALRVGAKLVLEDDFAPLKTKAICEKFQPTVLPGSPSIFLNLGKLIKRRPDVSAFASIRLVTNTGGRVPELGHTFIKVLVESFATRPFLMFGLTESFRSSFLPPDLYGQKHNAIGKAVPGVSLFLIDESDVILDAPHQIGEIVHSGRLISYGYYKDPGATEKLVFRLLHPDFDGITNGPMAIRSGDLGYFDEDGVFFHVGRKDNLIKVREQRTSLDQVEDMISQLGLFDVSAVVADKDADGMTIIHVFAVVAAGTSEQIGEIRRHLLAALPVHLAGGRLTLLSDLPTNVNGKICRKTLSVQHVVSESRLNHA